MVRNLARYTLFAPLALCTALTLFPALACADILAHIVLSEQRLHLYVDGEKIDVWKISAGKRKGWTNTGTFRPYFLSRHHRSSLFRGAPMGSVSARWRLPLPASLKTLLRGKVDSILRNSFSFFTSLKDLFLKF